MFELKDSLHGLNFVADPLHQGNAAFQKFNDSHISFAVSIRSLRWLSPVQRSLPLLSFRFLDIVKLLSVRSGALIDTDIVSHQGSQIHYNIQLNRICLLNICVKLLTLHHSLVSNP